MGLLFCLLMPWASAESLYVYRTRVNWVKLTEMSNRQLETRMANHPATIPLDQMEAILKLITIDRRYLIKDEIQSEYVFDNEEAHKFASYLVEGLSQASPYQAVAFSVVHKRPLFILRRDHLTWGEMWMAGDGLHIKFIKIFAKLEGDYEASGQEKLIYRAKGIRVALATGPGQTYGESGTSELVFDPKFDFVAAAHEQPAAPAASAPDSSPAPKTETGIPLPQTTSETAASGRSSVERLQELDNLRRDNLISKEEYGEIRQRILQGL